MSGLSSRGPQGSIRMRCAHVNIKKRRSFPFLTARSVRVSPQTLLLLTQTLFYNLYDNIV